MSIVFTNKGEIDPIAITTFGISVKDSSAIGYFGTGLKMAISVILRSGGNITIYSGKDKYSFSTKTTEVRCKSFEIICMNDKELGFTTDNAKNWKMWQAVREILCNCIDEGGEHYKQKLFSPKPSCGYTTIVVDSKEFEEAYTKRNEFILNKQNPIFETDYVEVYRGSTSSLFYKGVRVHESEIPYKFTYNFKTGVSLTEDRTMATVWYDVNYTLCSSILESENVEFINSILNVGDLYKEYSLEWCSGEPSEVFRDKLNINRGKINSKAPPKLIRKFKPDIREELRTMEELQLNSRQHKMLNKAKDMLSGVGIFQDVYRIKVMPSLGDGVLGLADKGNGIIYLSQSVFDLGTKYLAGTIYEEHIHITHGVMDETRAFQDVVIQHLMTAIEQIKDDIF